MTQATIRMAALHGWEGLLADRGLPAPDLPAASAAQRDEPLPLSAFVRFSEQVVHHTRDAALPWRAGLHYDLARLGWVGDAINAAGTVGGALRRLVDYFALLQDSTHVRLDREGGMATVSYRILDPDIWPRHHDAMFTLGIVTQILRRGMTGNAHGAIWGGWDKVEFAFEAQAADLRAPDPRHDMAKLLQAPCTFGADANHIRFPLGILDLPLPQTGRASDIRQLNGALTTRQRATPIVQRLANVVFRDLNCLTIDQDRIAREIGMSSRTMRRKLAEAGSSYQQVLDDCRMRQAAFEFRARPELSIAQVALRLGYAEHSTFTRAFHRWAGIAPQAWREQRLHDGP
jgi:AraC-like DNA-binding protein